MASKEELTGIRDIVERAFAGHFGEHDMEITLEPWVDHGNSCRESEPLAGSRRTACR